MKYIFSLLLLFPCASFANIPDCEEQTIFYIHEAKNRSVTHSNIYCDFGVPKTQAVKSTKGVLPGYFAVYHAPSKSFQSLPLENTAIFSAFIKNLLAPIRTDEDFRQELKQEYIDNFLAHEHAYADIVKKLVFSEKDLAEIETGISEHPYQFFKATLGERLLMDGKIISREEWWADETYAHQSVYLVGCEDWKCYRGPIPTSDLRTNYLSNLAAQDARERIVKTFNNGRDPMSYYPVDRIIIHHTAGGYKANREEWEKYMQDLHKYHGLKLRWWDVGYHYLIDGAGNIYEWRAGGKYVLGAHVSVHNYGSVGISLMSDGEYSPEMLTALDELILYLADEYQLDLTKKTRVRRHDLSGWMDGWVLLAHKELDDRKPKDPEIDMDVLRYMLKRKALERKEGK